MVKNRDVEVILVTSKTPTNDFADSNNRLKAMVEANDNFHLADWTVAYNESYFSGDSERIHPVSNGGYSKWVEAIANALNGIDDCTSFEGDYPEYLQCDSRWGSLAYGSGNTMCSSSCGASSMAMLATVAAGQDIYPNDIADLLGGSYYWATIGSGMAELDKRVGEHYGFEVEAVSYGSLDDAETKMKEYLEKGYMIHLSGAGSYPFSSVGHYIGIFSIKDGDTVITADSGSGNDDNIKLHDIVHAGMHGGVFSAIKAGGSSTSCEDNTCSAEESDNSTGNGNVIKAVEDIIELANNNGSTYTWGGGHTNDASVFDAMLNGAPISVDCTGFASLVIYKAFGEMTTFTSYSIFGNSQYEEVDRSDVQPGDIFAFNSPQGHGGIVVEAANGVVTKIAETGGTEGRSGSNNNIGYSGADSYSVNIINGSEGHFFRWKGN